MKISKTRSIIVIVVLAVVVVISLSLQRTSAPGTTIADRSLAEKAAPPSAPEKSTLSISRGLVDGGLFSSVEWRDRWEEKLDEYPRTYAKLRDLAEEGDPAATRRLVGLLGSCKHAVLPLSDVELEEIVAQMRTSYSMPTVIDGRLEFLPETAGGLGNMFESGAELTAFIDEWHANTRTCTRVTVEQRGEVEYWLELLQAQDPDTDYSKRPPRDMNRDEEIAYLESTWATGDPRALAELATIYSEYDAQITDPSALVKAFAYIYTYYQAAIESARYHSEPERVSELQWALKTVTSNYEALLSDHEISQAYQLAKRTVEDNEECCIRLSPSGN